MAPAQDTGSPAPPPALFVAPPEPSPVPGDAEDEAPRGGSVFLEEPDEAEIPVVGAPERRGGRGQRGGPSGGSGGPGSGGGAGASGSGGGPGGRGGQRRRRRQRRG